MVAGCGGWLVAQWTQMHSLRIDDARSTSTSSVGMRVMKQWHSFATPSERQQDTVSTRYDLVAVDVFCQRHANDGTVEIWAIWALSQALHLKLILFFYASLPWDR